MLFVTAFICEVSLRLVDKFATRYAPGNEKGVGIQSDAMKTFVQAKINKLWMHKREERKNIFEPPFDVFVNKDFQNPERLRFISTYSKLPPHETNTVENFLRLNDMPVNETFTVTINSLGFRGAEHAKEKSAKTYRILLLGSYPAFGHAVNDDETYASVLENDLNKRARGGRKFEVWNGGKQGSTSIMGYSRLVNEIEGYSPDVILWDYGWIELYLARDMVKNNGQRVQLKKLNKFEGMFIKACLKTVLSKLALCKFSVNKISKVSYDDAISGWKESMTLLSAWSKQHRVPVIFLRHRGVMIPHEEYAKFDRPSKGMHFVDTAPSLEPRITEEEVNLFWSRPNWLSELKYTKEDVLNDDSKLMFLGDAIQYNKIGYKRIGLYLSDFFIENNFKF